MKQIFKLKNFNKWMLANRISDEMLCLAVKEMGQGLIDADLGGHLIKKRIAYKGRGKRESARVLVGTDKKECMVFSIWLFKE